MSEQRLWWLEGCTLETIENNGPDFWQLRFTEGGWLTIEATWRLIADQRIVFGNRDDQHKFGLPEPIDGKSLVKQWIQDRPVQSTSVDSFTGDVRIEFGEGVRLDIFNSSGGYEGWQSGGRGGEMVVARGGGNIGTWDSDA